MRGRDTSPTPDSEVLPDFGFGSLLPREGFASAVGRSSGLESIETKRCALLSLAPTSSAELMKFLPIGEAIASDEDFEFPMTCPVHAVMLKLKLKLSGSEATGSSALASNADCAPCVEALPDACDRNLLDF